MIIDREPFKGYARNMGLLYRFGLVLKNRRFWSKHHLAFSVLLLKLLEYLAAGLGCISQKLGGVRIC